MMQDFSELHTPTGALGSLPAQKQEWQQYRLIQNQVEAFHRDGFLAGIQVLDDHQVETLCTELAVLVGPSHPSHALFHEYHPNVSSNPDPVSRAWHVADRAGVSRRAHFGQESCGVEMGFQRIPISPPQIFSNH
jgi:hypothetical protein